MGRARGVVTVGRGQVPVRPDLVRATLGAQGAASDVGAALATATAALTAMRAALLAAGVAPDDVRTGRTQTWTSEPDQVSGTGERAHAHLGLDVTLRDVATAGDQVAAALGAAGDAARLDRLELALADPSAASVRAREAAFHDARAKATQLASLAGRALGEVASIADEPVSAPFFTAPSAEAFGMRTAKGVPIDPGTEVVEAHVTVAWDWGTGPASKDA